MKLTRCASQGRLKFQYNPHHFCFLHLATPKLMVDNRDTRRKNQTEPAALIARSERTGLHNYKKDPFSTFFRRKTHQDHLAADLRGGQVKLSHGTNARRIALVVIKKPAALAICELMWYSGSTLLHHSF